MHASTVDRGQLYPQTAGPDLSITPYRTTEPQPRRRQPGRRATTAKPASIRDLMAAVERGDAWWGILAACRDEDPDLFFPEPGQHPDEARRICGSCLVRAQCHQFALTTTGRDDDHGVFGGTSESERRPQHAATARRAPLTADRARTVAAFKLAAAVGTNEAAARLDLSPRALRDAFDRWGLGRPSGPPVQKALTPMTRDEAVQAFALAEQVGLCEAARQLGATTGRLYWAFDRWGLGRPDSSRSAARWARQLHSGDRQRVLRTVQRQEIALARARRVRPAPVAVRGGAA